MTFAPALKWLATRFGRASVEAAEARGVMSKFNPFDPYSVVAVLLELAQQSEGIANADADVISFLGDYRPDLVAQIIALRRNNLTRVTNDWPKAALADYFRNVLVDRINCPIRTGYAHLPTIQYWAGVLERYSPQSFDILSDHESVDRDTGEKEFAEGREFALGGEIHPNCQYDRSQQPFKAAMWWQGWADGRIERQWQALTGQVQSAPENS
jgi:hypothetical protein